jgi:hypothetical protein
MRLLLVLIATASVAAGTRQIAPAGWRTYVDPQQRFQFSYPASLGDPRPGTDSGFGNRVAALRLPGFAGLGGEAVLTSGFVDLDIQAAGGLYDAIARGVLQDADIPLVIAALPPLTPATVCGVLETADHTANLKIPPRLLPVARQIDRMRNVDPALPRCTVADRVAVFHKEATLAAGVASGRQHLFGAVRFLDAPYSSFQLVRGLSSPPSDVDLDVLERIVRSFSAGAAR